MKCAQCNYVLDVFDAQCPQCSRKGTSAVAPSSRPTVTGTTQALLETARAAKQNAEQKRRSISRASVQYTFIGIALALVAAIPLGLALRFFRYVHLLLLAQAKDDQTLTLAASLLTHVAGSAPFLGLGIGAAFYLGHQWQSLALAHPETTGSRSRQAKPIAAGIALLVGGIFLVWQYFDASSNSVSSYGSLLFKLISGMDSVTVMAVFIFVLAVSGALVGYSWGQMVGLQNHENKLLSGSDPSTPQKAVGKARVGAVVGSANGFLESDWGTRIVGVVSFLVPLIGVVLYLVYNNKDQEKTRAASRGIIGGFSFVMPCVGVLLYVAYSNSDEEKAHSAAWGIGLSIVFFVLYVGLRLIGQS